MTEHDYFGKVLNREHQATGSAQVCDVATMGSELVVARPDDTVEGCIEVMTMKVGPTLASNTLYSLCCQ